MAPIGWKFVYFIVAISCFLVRLVKADDDNLKEDFQGESYIVPEEVDEHADKIRKGDVEFYFYAPRLSHNLARQICANKYHGRLAWIQNMETAKFLAEALSESRLDLDTVWTGGKRDNEEDSWEWKDDLRQEDIDETITKEIVTISQVKASNRNCLGFSRVENDAPQFRALACTAERSVLCEAHAKSSTNGHSTHTGWISSGNLHYKIFPHHVTWSESYTQCANYGPSVTLARVPDYDTAQTLGRYMLIGRPSLRHAWIGAKWDKHAYKWMENDIALNNEQNETTKFPPWKRSKVVKRNGCVLLQQHVSETVTFAEARCERRSAFICQKEDIDQSKTIKTTDVIIGERAYRLIYNKMTWDDAFLYCQNLKDVTSKLAEVRDEIASNNLLYVMGDNKTAITHIWLGGRYKLDHHESDNAGWYWVSDKTPIPFEDGNGLHWVKNSSYSQEVENINLCLNMDRERHSSYIHYGTTCSEPQQFICEFTTGEVKPGDPEVKETPAEVE